MTLHCKQRCVPAKDAMLSETGPIYTKVSASTLQQQCNDASDSALIKNNGAIPEWGCNPLSSDSIVSMRTVSLASLQSCPSVDTDAWCKRAHTISFSEVT